VILPFPFGRLATCDAWYKGRFHANQGDSTSGRSSFPRSVVSSATCASTTVTMIVSCSQFRPEFGNRAAKGRNKLCQPG